MPKMDIVCNDNDTGSAFALVVDSPEELFDVLDRNDLFTKKGNLTNPAVSAMWYSSLEDGLMIANPKYIKCTMRVKSEEDLFLEEPPADRCFTCGQELPIKD